METDRLQKETEAEVLKIQYNFHKQINEALQSGDPVRITLTVQAFNLYMRTITSFQNTT